MIIKKKDIIKALKKSGVKKGDAVLVHSNISSIGRLSASLKNSLKIFYDSIKFVVGREGTICAPAFFFDFEKNGKVFNLKKSPITDSMGLFSKYLLSMKNNYRSLNPITSVVSVGNKAKKICNKSTASGYGLDSPYDVLTKIKGKMIFVGVDLAYMTYVHYVEQLIGVPQRYFKIFDGDIIDGKKKIKLPIVTFLRYMDFDIKNGIDSNTKKFEKAGIVKKVKLGKNFIRTIKFTDAFKFLKKKIQKDPYYLLKKKPKFKKAQIPIA